MRNKIIFLLPIILILLVGFWAFKVKPLSVVDDAGGPELQKPDVKPSVGLPSQQLPLSKDPKTVAWNLFQKYLFLNKARDLKGVESVVYKLSPICVDEKTRLDCEARMALAYQYGSVLKQESFKNVWSDEKQIILSTDFWQEEGKDTKDLGRYRAIIVFVKSNEEWKLLNFSPFKGAIVSIGEAPMSEVQDRVIRYTEDKDMDGRSDYNEECLDMPTDKSTDFKCLKTNPKIRDTDGNGWWDGVDVLF